MVDLPCQALIGNNDGNERRRMAAIEISNGNKERSFFPARANKMT